MAMLRSNSKYCATVWNPWKRNIRKQEMVQRRAARLVTNIFHNTSSVTEILYHFQWDTLEARRCKLQLTMVYKIVNNIERNSDKSPPPLTWYSSSRGSPTSYSTVQSMCFFSPARSPLWKIVLIAYDHRANCFVPNDHLKSYVLRTISVRPPYGARMGQCFYDLSTATGLRYFFLFV